MENENKNVAPVAQTAAPVTETVAPVAQPAAAPEARTFSSNDRNSSARRSNSNRGNGRGRRAPVQKEYEERVVHISRISKTVKGGRRMRFSALVVIGNGKGKFGFGIGKSIEVPDAIKKALQVAENDVKTIPIVKNGTIPHTVEGNFGACKVFLKPAPAGTGVIAGGPVRAILELAGIKNVYSKVYGSRTSINVIKATAEGLSQLKTKTVLELAAEDKKEEK